MLLYILYIQLKTIMIMSPNNSSHSIHARLHTSPLSQVNVEKKVAYMCSLSTLI